MPFTLQGRTALVTGAGRGMGQAIARKLAAAGASVFVTDLEEDLTRETALQIRASGSEAAFTSGDLTLPEFPQQVVDATLAQFGSLDIIVNNAGYTWDNVIHKTTDEQFQCMLDIHVVAPFRILRAASAWLRDTAKREIAEGRSVMRKVVNTTSIFAEGNAGQSGYSSGKAAVLGLTRTLAKEWGRYNINVNAVGYGLMKTRLTGKSDGGETLQVHGRAIPIGVPPAAHQAMIDTAIASTPLGRLGTPEDAAGAVLFLCSPLSDYITGEILMCSGGQHF